MSAVPVTFECPNCFRELSTSSLHVGKTIRCPLCRYEFLELRRRIDMAELNFTCAVRRELFTIVFQAPPGVQFRILRIEHGTGTTDRAVYGGHAERAGASIDRKPEYRAWHYDDYDFSAFACIWCGCRSFRQCRHGHLFCDGRAAGISDVCAACGTPGEYRTPIATLTAKTASFSRPAALLPPQPTARPALTSAVENSRLMSALTRLLVSGAR